MFKCFQCGKCCKDITFFVTERQIAVRHANYRGVDPKIIQRFRRSLEYIKSDSFEQREHYFLPGPCPFFCEAEGCLIYLSRPYACRNFLCGRTDEKEKLEDDQWRHKKIVLSPDNKAFKDIVLENVEGDDFKIVAEFVGVLE